MIATCKPEGPQEARKPSWCGEMGFMSGWPMDWLLLSLAMLDKRVWSPYFTELEACVVTESKQQKTKLFLRGRGSSLVCPEPNPGGPDCLSTAWWLSALSASLLPGRNCYWLQHQSALESIVLPHCPLLASWLVRSGLRRALGSLSPVEPAPSVALRTGGGTLSCQMPQRQAHFSLLQFLLQKNTSLLCQLSNICEVSRPLL